MSAEHIDLSETLLDRHHEVFRCLGLLSKRVPEGWCVVGGLMVMIAGRSVGASDVRSSQTKDGDIVIDVVADETALGRVFRELGSLGYESPPEAFDDPRFARCTVSAGASTVDILAPDDAKPELLELEPDIRSLAIPGGRRALDLARPVTITYDEEAFDVELRVPDIYGAIVVKSAAVVADATADQTRHIQDVAFLLSAIVDPTEAATSMSSDADLMRAVDRGLRDRASPAWRYLDDDARLRALAALDFIVA